MRKCFDFQRARRRRTDGGISGVSERNFETGGATAASCPTNRLIKPVGAAGAGTGPINRLTVKRVKELCWTVGAAGAATGPAKRLMKTVGVS